jgi:hypothetical protein
VTQVPASNRGSGSAAGGATKIYDSTLLVDTASFDTGAASIAAGYTFIEAVLYVRSTRVAALDEVWFQFNADAGANYDWQRAGAVGATGTFSALAGDNGFDAIIPGASSTASEFGVVRLTVPNYDNAIAFKTATWIEGMADGSANARAFVRSGVWKSAAAITRLKVVSLNAANLKTGSRLSVYGYA